MNEKVNGAKAFVAALIAAGTALWGWFGWLVLVWVGCMVLDYITGSMAAAKAHDWSSARAREGLWHKAGMIIAVVVAAVGDILIGLILHIDGLRLPFDYTVLLAPVVVAWYSLTELGSVIENAAKLGAPVPGWLRKLLKISADAIDKAGDKIAGEDEE